MKNVVLKLQTKGQIMLPKEWRKGVDVYQAVKEGDVIILKPVSLSTDKEIIASASKVIKKNSELLKRLAK